MVSYKRSPRAKHGKQIKSTEELQSTTRREFGITLKKFPKGMLRSREKVSKFFNALEVAVLETRGVLGPYEYAAIQRACLGLQSYEMVMHWLANTEEATLEQRQSLLRDSMRALEARDRALKDLGLDRAAYAVEGGLDDAPWLLAAPAPQDATAGRTEAYSGATGPADGDGEADSGTTVDNGTASDS